MVVVLFLQLANGVEPHLAGMGQKIFFDTGLSNPSDNLVRPAMILSKRSRIRGRFHPGPFKVGKEIEILQA